MTVTRSYRIRTAEPSDARALAHTHRQCWMEAYEGHLPSSVLDGRKAPEFETLWERRTGSPKEGPICIAEDPDGLIAGFASGRPLRTDLPGYDGELVTLYVLEELQQRGLGTEMFARKYKIDTCIQDMPFSCASSSLDGRGLWRRTTI